MVIENCYTDIRGEIKYNIKNKWVGWLEVNGSYIKDGMFYERVRKNKIF